VQLLKLIFRGGFSQGYFRRRNSPWRIQPIFRKRLLSKSLTHEPRRPFAADVASHCRAMSYNTVRRFRGVLPAAQRRRIPRKLPCIIDCKIRKLQPERKIDRIGKVMFREWGCSYLHRRTATEDLPVENQTLRALR
jgi:hypothetical protein